MQAREKIAENTAGIGPLDESAMEMVRERLDSLTKPQGSLGRLEAIAIQLGGIQAKALPSVSRKALIIMAGDHGVTAEGVSAYPPEVTPQMVANFLAGRAAVNVFSRRVGVQVYVVDVGVANPIPQADNGCQGGRFVSARVRPGTANLARGPAMQVEEAEAALEVGIDTADRAVDEGAEVVAVGEMGIGNTTPSAAIVAAVTGHSPLEVTGFGTGIDEAGLHRKVKAITRALEVNQPDPEDGIDLLHKIGGLEIAGMAGAIIGAAARRRPVVIDGLISAAAAIAAVKVAPSVREYLIPSHASKEPGHRAALDWLGLRPLLDLEMRLGEGTGAVLALPLLDAAVDVLTQMATFAEAGVSRKDG